MSLRQFFQDKGFDSRGRIYLSPIPPKLLNNASEAYELAIDPKEVIVLVDNTMFGSGKDGCLIGEKSIVFREPFESPVEYALERIEKIHSKDGAVFINGRKVYKFAMPDNGHLVLTFQMLGEWLASRAAISQDNSQLQHELTASEFSYAARGEHSESLHAFVSETIRRNKSKILPFLAAKTGELSAGILRDDESLEKFALLLYSSLPSVAQLAVKERTFIKFISENRDKILGEIYQPQTSDSAAALQKILFDVLAQCKSEFCEDDDGEIDPDLEQLLFFVLESHVKLVSKRLPSMPFVSESTDNLAPAASAQLLVAFLGAYSMSKTSAQLIENLGRAVFFQVSSLLTIYYETGAEFLERTDPMYSSYALDREAFDVFFTLFLQPDSERNAATAKIPKEETLIQFLGHEPINLPRSTMLSLLKESEEIHYAWLRKIQEIEQRRQDD